MRQHPRERQRDRPRGNAPASGVEVAAAEIDRGEFVFRRSTKLKGIVPEGYHTALQNRDRIRRMLGEWFGRVEFVDRGFGDHDGVVAGSPGATISE